MITLTIRMKVRSEKHNELVQTLSMLMNAINKEEGCVHCSLFQNITHENLLLMDQEWEDREHMDNHLKSNNFKILRGAMSYLVSEDPVITMATSPDRSGMKELKV